jgi:hypothetical protein
MRELLKATAGTGGAVGGPNQAAYTPPAARPAFKSLADGTSGSTIAGSSPSGSSDNS